MFLSYSQRQFTNHLNVPLEFQDMDVKYRDKSVCRHFFGVSETIKLVGLMRNITKTVSSNCHNHSQNETVCVRKKQSWFVTDEESLSFGYSDKISGPNAWKM